MKTDEWALVVAIVAICISAGSVYYSRRLAIQDAEKMKRSPPIPEIVQTITLVDRRLTGVKASPIKSINRDGFFQTHLLLRSIDTNASVEITEIILRKKSGGIAKLSDLQESEGDKYPRNLKENLDSSLFKKNMIVSIKLAPAQRPNERDTHSMTVYSNCPIEPGDIRIKWRWLDGSQH